MSVAASTAAPLVADAARTRRPTPALDPVASRARPSEPEPELDRATAGDDGLKRERARAAGAGFERARAAATLGRRNEHAQTVAQPRRKPLSRASSGSHSSSRRGARAVSGKLRLSPKALGARYKLVQATTSNTSSKLDRQPFLGSTSRRATRGRGIQTTRSSADSSDDVVKNESGGPSAAALNLPWYRLELRLGADETDLAGRSAG